MRAILTISILFAWGILVGDYTEARANKLLDDAKTQSHVVGNSEELEKLLAKAADGDAEAQFKLGLMYHLGKTLPQSYLRAAGWYKLASNGGNVNARNNLGVIHRDGLGVPANDVMAYMWFNLAATDQGPYGIARKNRDRLNSSMDPQGILQAQQLGEEYLQTLSVKKQQMAVSRVGGARVSEDKEMKEPSVKPAEKAAPTPKKVKGVKVASRGPHASDTGVEKWIGSQLESLMAAIGLEESRAPKYFVQLGLFRKNSNVNRVRKRLSAERIDLRVENVTVRGTEYQRLRVGPFDTDPAARAMASRVNSMFRIKSLLVPSTY